jgi:hypothetical protein
MGRNRVWAGVMLVIVAAGCASKPDPAPRGTPLSLDTPVRGWTILSDSEQDDLAVIAAAKSYNINHLQLSHHLVHDLRDMTRFTRDKVNRLIDAGHRAGISEVVVWDHVLNDINYYPAWYRTGPKYTIDLDNPKFWEWFKADYRRMLDQVPNADGVVLTFIETGARVEKQYSKTMKTNQEKLAAVVNAVAEVVIEERKLNLYARTFAYTYEEYDNIIGAIKLFKNPNIRLMMKEVPHDFFLTHPNDKYVGKIERPTLIEFDAAGEYNGQGIIATTWPQYIIERYRDLGHRPHVIGYTARTDRYYDTRMIGQASEINLYALKRAAEDPNVTADQVYVEFITARYGASALPYLEPAFRSAFDIVLCSLYTLGTVVSNHSAMNYDPYSSSFVRHVSGKWLDPPTVKLGHGVNQELHYWKDVVNHIAPPFTKTQKQLSSATKPSPKTPSRWDEVPDVIKSRWITPGEQMDEQFLRHIVTEKDYGVKLAEQSLARIEDAQGVLSPADYQQIHEMFERTLLTARLHRAVASAYYGYRVWCRGGEFQTDFVKQTTNAGLDEIEDVVPLIRGYPGKVPKGQWDWREDPAIAQTYYKWITRGTWPKQSDKSDNPYAGKAFPR